MRIRVVDTETTGMDPTDHVVEIAAWDVHCDEGGKLLSLPFFVGERFVRPPVPIPPQASAVHHIIDEDVITAAPWDKVWPEFVDDEVDAYAAHNARFDRQWLTDDRCGYRKWIDTYRCALRLYPSAPSHGNQALRYWLRPEGLKREVAGGAHRAAGDAYVTAHLLSLMLARASFEQLIDWTNTPAMLPKVNFGKHQGKLWSEVDRSYLQWVAKQSDMSEDVLYTAKHWLSESFRLNGGR